MYLRVVTTKCPNQTAKKALKLFDKIVVAVSDGENKNYLFDAEERLEIVRNALFKDLKMNKKKNNRYFI